LLIEEFGNHQIRTLQALGVRKYGIEGTAELTLEAHTAGDPLFVKMRFSS
jgi:hypothetical protein